MRLPFAVCATLLAGCLSGGAPHSMPKATVPAAWSASATSGAADERALSRWWMTLNDPVLSDLISRSVEANLDVHTSLARIREARARRGLSAAQQYPALSAGAGRNHSRTAETATTSYSAGFDASWEVDVFGTKRNGVRAADARVQARIEDLRDVLVTLTAEVASEYLNVAIANTRITTAEANLATQTETLEIARFRFRGGLATEIDVQQAANNLEQTRASIPQLRTSRQQSLHRLAVLLGQPPGTLDSAVTTVRALPDVPVTLAIGVPADVLRRRPDVRRAERELAAQIAEVSAANAAKYPQLSLSGSIGLESLVAGDLLSAGARLLTVGGRLTQPIFDAGRIRQNIKIQNALQEQAALAYEQRVLGALEEVQNALVAFAEEHARRRSLIAATAAAKQAAHLAHDQYRSGLVDFQVVLTSERSLLAAQDALAVSNGAIATNAVRLYKAAGGGWSTTAERQE